MQKSSQFKPCLFASCLCDGFRLPHFEHEHEHEHEHENENVNGEGEGDESFAVQNSKQIELFQSRFLFRLSNLSQG